MALQKNQENTAIDLQLIAQNLLDSNQNIQNHFEKNDNDLIITANKLAKKYPSLSNLEGLALIKYLNLENNVLSIIPNILNHDGGIKLLGVNNVFIEDFEIISYKFTESLASVEVIINDVSLILNAKISKSCIAQIAKSENGIIEGKGIPDIKLLEEKIIFTPFRDIPKSDYKLIKNHGKKTKKYRDLLIDIEDLKSGEIYRYVAVNSELEKLISKYGKETKFSIISHQSFINKDNESAIKVIIKDLNFTDDLSDLEI